MTEHPVYLRATEVLADLEHRELIALRALSAVRGEKQRTEDFLEMYRYFAGGPIEVEEPDFEQATNPESHAKATEGKADNLHSGALDGVVSRPSRDGGFPVSNTPGESGTAREASGGSAPSNGIAGLKEGPEAAPRTNSPANPGDSDDGGPVSPDGMRCAVVADLTAGHTPTWPLAPADDGQVAPIPLDRARAVLLRQIAGKPDRPTLATRVTAVHAEHPDWSQKQIAEALGVGTGSVANAIRGKGLQFVKEPASKPKDDSKRAKVEAYIKGHPDATAKELSDALGISDATIRAIAFTHNLNVRKLSPEELAASRRAGAMKALKLRTGGAEFLKDKIIACNREHPDWDTHQLAEACGTTPGKVSAYKSQYSIPIPTKAVESKLGGAHKFVREDKPVVERQPAPAPAPPVDDGAESYRRKYGEPRPTIEVGDQDEDYVAPAVPRIKPSKGTQFRLKDKTTGLYLHQDLHGMTEGHLKMVARNEYPWKGNKTQLDGVRKLLPSTVKLIVVEVQK